MLTQSEALLQEGLFSEAQRKKALKMQAELNKPLTRIVVKLGFIDEGDLVEFLARQHKMVVADIAELILPENLVKRIPRKLIEKYLILPIAFRDNKLTIATADPYDIEAIEEVQMVLDSHVEVQLARRSELLKAINEVFYGEGSGVDAKGDTRVRSPMARLKGMGDALIPLLIEKGLITEEELSLKARELGIGAKSKRPGEGSPQ